VSVTAVPALVVSAIEPENNVGSPDVTLENKVLIAPKTEVEVLKLLMYVDASELLGVSKSNA
jgi:hypothetical protein